jgi:uncharacterized protein HemY
VPSAPRSRRLLAREAEDDVQRALDWAEVAAMLGDFAEAVAWLDRAAELIGSLPDGLAARRREWLAHVR